VAATRRPLPGASAPLVLLAVLAARAHAAHLRILALGDSITTGGGYPVHILPEEETKAEADSLLEALDVDADGKLSANELSELVAQHEGLGALHADRDADGFISPDELRAHVIPTLFGVPARASSYRLPLARGLRAEGYRVSWVGDSCQIGKDEWLRWHGCDDIAGAERNFLGFWGWSALHILSGHPNQRQRGALEQWLRPSAHAGATLAAEDREDVGSLAYDVVLLHLGTNDLASSRDVAGLVRLAPGLHGSGDERCG